jgi:hypothetical protein
MCSFKMGGKGGERESFLCFVGWTAVTESSIGCFIYIYLVREKEIRRGEKRVFSLRKKNKKQKWKGETGEKGRTRKREGEGERKRRKNLKRAGS